MSLLAWAVLGAVAGTIARALHPDPEPGGLVATIAVGVVGAVIGGGIGAALLGASIRGFSGWSLIVALVGALLLLVIYRLATPHSTDPRHRSA